MTRSGSCRPRRPASPRRWCARRCPRGPPLRPPRRAWTPRASGTGGPGATPPSRQGNSRGRCGDQARGRVLKGRRRGRAGGAGRIAGADHRGLTSGPEWRGPQRRTRAQPPPPCRTCPASAGPRWTGRGFPPPTCPTASAATRKATVEPGGRGGAGLAPLTTGSTSASAGAVGPGMGGRGTPTRGYRLTCLSAPGNMRICARAHHMCRKRAKSTHPSRAKRPRALGGARDSREGPSRPLPRRSGVRDSDIGIHKARSGGGGGVDPGGEAASALATTPSLPRMRGPGALYHGKVRSSLRGETLKLSGGEEGGNGGACPGPGSLPPWLPPPGVAGGDRPGPRGRHATL